jgi:hypothetical protein
MNTCELHGLDSRYFSAHSLRKGAITHMRAQGTSVDDRRNRRNYGPYDQSVGLGPLGLQGGRKPGVKDVERLLPVKRHSL